jgi:triacylglycerol esterase/lipase EstA (alpha/beta hydrolase family)
MNGQSNNPKLLCRAYILLFALGLISCSSPPYFKEQTLRASYKDAPASILNRTRISKPSRQAIRNMEQRNSQTPTNINERIAVAELAIAEAKKSSNQSPEQAFPYYLKTTETLWPIVKNSPPPLNHKHQDQQKNLLLAESLYKYAAGQIARLVVQHSSTTTKQQFIKLSNHTLSINTRSQHSIHPSFFDVINPVDTFTYGNIGKEHHKSNGLGAALVGRQNGSPARLKANSLLSPDGLNIPINVIIDYPHPNKPRITLTNLLKTTTTHLTGTRRVLAADYSAPVAAIAAAQAKNLGLSIALSPEEIQQQTGLGLVAIGPYDPKKIPIIFVHGLISQPTTWTTVTNHLMADKTIRENYQFLYYFYQTGYTPIISGAQFRQALLDFHQDHAKEKNNKLNHTVLIGHSMGGLLSSIQSRTFDEKLWSQLFKKNPTESTQNSAYAQLKILFENPSLKYIERTVFIATPHLGSKLANRWIGGIGSSLIKIPQSVLSLQFQTTTESMTDFGRSLVNQGPSNSVTQLKANNPTLKLLYEQPFNSRVTYHSIIGDRGRSKLTKSSDGVVPYWSSHLDGAASEKMVPANHEAHLHPQTHEELSRILHLHLKSSRID